VVTLTGCVSSYFHKIAAERIAKRVYGVKAVANDITIMLPDGAEQTDPDIAAAALSALKWNPNVPDKNIKITVRNAWVTLEGEVEWWYQKEAAEQAVHNLIGVRGVTNDLTIKNVVHPGDVVKKKIEAAFKRSAEIDARGITVEAHDGKVILHGKVHSCAERDEAQQAAWAAPGVSAVENHITVTP
jgi:osmotically-inducible protein OsmY